MPQWLVFSLLANLLWGVWAIFLKLGTRRMSSVAAKIWETVGFTVATVPILMYAGFHVVWNADGFLHSVLGGLTGGLANYYFFRAYSAGGGAAVVTALIATCPVLTIACAYLFLH